VRCADLLVRSVGSDLLARGAHCCSLGLLFSWFRTLSGAQFDMIEGLELMVLSFSWLDVCVLL